MVTTTAKSIDDVITEVRALVNDSMEPFRFTDALLVQLMNTALRELYRLRPDAYIGNFTQGTLGNNAINTYSTADLDLDPATAFPVDDRLFFSPVVLYVAGKTELSDDEFTDDNRAMTVLKAFRDALVGVGG